MNKPNIANLYRRHTRRNPAAAALPDVDTLLALAEGEAGAETERMLGDVGRSGVHADLLRLARDLVPESARLGVRLEQAFEAAHGGHRRDHRAARAVEPRRGWLRVGGALAAGLLVAVAVWSWQHDRAAAPANVAALKAPAQDRIFAALGREDEQAKGDVIFRAEFARDRIFRAKFNGG
jgi:hypothetical protein